MRLQDGSPHRIAAVVSTQCACALQDAFPRWASAQPRVHANICSLSRSLPFLSQHTGTTSFVRHLTGGTLLSVANMAMSIGRNMERLSLDSEHASRRAEARHATPQRVGGALSSGIKGFGISLVSAVAGIVDQPMRTLVHEEPVRATSVLAGVGRGMLGVITKPVGGAMEFVHSASLGILASTGLHRERERLQVPVQHLSDHSDAIKYTWKLLEAPDADVTSVHACCVVGSDVVFPALILLTHSCMLAISVIDDSLQIALPLHRIQQWSATDLSPHHLDLVLAQPEETPHGTPDLDTSDVVMGLRETPHLWYSPFLHTFASVHLFISICPPPSFLGRSAFWPRVWVYPSACWRRACHCLAILCLTFCEPLGPI